MSLLLSCATLFFCQVIAFTPVGDLGRFNHTISSLGQLNQIGQINRDSTGEGFTSPSVMLSLASSLFLCVCVFAPVSFTCSVMVQLQSSMAQLAQGGAYEAKFMVPVVPHVWKKNSFEKHCLHE